LDLFGTRTREEISINNFKTQQFGTS